MRESESRVPPKSLANRGCHSESGQRPGEEPAVSSAGKQQVLHRVSDSVRNDIAGDRSDLAASAGLKAGRPAIPNSAPSPKLFASLSRLMPPARLEFTLRTAFRWCCQWVLDAAREAVEWLYQPLRFDSVALCSHSTRMKSA